MVESFKHANKHKVIFEAIRQPMPDNSPGVDDSFSNDTQSSSLNELAQVVAQNEKVIFSQIIRELQDKTLRNAYLITKMTEERRNLVKSYYKAKEHHYRVEMDTALKMSLQSRQSAGQDFTYEELLKLGEEIGNVNVGFNDDEIRGIKETVLQTSDTCSICLNLGEQGKVLACGHFFHSECIDTWLKTKKSCPFCLSDVVIEDYF